jgi:hypothetical protein
MLQRRKLSLGMLGGLFIFGGLMANLFSRATMPPPKNRAEALGRASATGLLVLIGLVLVAIHLIRRARSQGR